MKLMKKYLSNQRGVTLIELLAVIVILGILAAVAVPVVLNQVSDANSKADQATVAVIEDAVQRAILKGDIKLPTSKSELADTEYAALVSKYLKKKPTPSKDTSGEYKIEIDNAGNVTVTEAGTGRW